jgi:thioredoxin-related protein
MYRRQVTLFLVVCVVSLSTFASTKADELAGIPWKNDLQQALQATRANQRPMLIFFTMEGCHYCSKMKQVTYQDQQLTSDICESYIPVSVDADDAKALIAQLSIEAYPATVIISPKLQVLDQIVGFMPADELRARLAAVKSQSAAPAGR